MAKPTESVDRMTNADEQRVSTRMASTSPDPVEMLSAPPGIGHGSIEADNNYDMEAEFDNEHDVEVEADSDSHLMYDDFHNSKPGLSVASGAAAVEDGQATENIQHQGKTRSKGKGKVKGTSKPKLKATGKRKRGEEEEEEQQDTKEYKPTAIKAVRQAKDHAADYPSVQLLIEWEGYQDLTWHRLDDLQNDRLMLELLFANIPKAATGGKVTLPIADAQGKDEDEETTGTMPWPWE
ncbi:hypothetical protein VMCG_10797 [Cytospora schulzeri]|uniref:Chromo domain-containing protein n=1 Tax=Cytospora schulzeri TaxID=448051 RepID=A0A423VA90_9PEZI|nr:hypothetical protein VMCG_10797 [Valsa malicola]